MTTVQDSPPTISINDNETARDFEERVLRTYGLPWRRNENSLRLMFEPVLAFVRKRESVRQHELLRAAAECLNDHGYRPDANGWPTYNADGVHLGRLGIARPKQYTIRTVVTRCLEAMMANREAIDGSRAYAPDPGLMIDRLESMRNHAIELLSKERRRGAVRTLALAILGAEDLIVAIEDLGPEGNVEKLQQETDKALSEIQKAISSWQDPQPGAVH